MQRDAVPTNTLELARYLIGKLVVRRFADLDVLTAGRIVETEAYALGDPASHAFRGRTQRNKSMFESHLFAYVYFIYGSAFCLNVTSEVCGVGAAVLIRALEPVEGLAHMRSRRGFHIRDRDLARGPGRLCAALAIDRHFDGIDLASDLSLWLADDRREPPRIGVSARIGLTRAAQTQARFYAAGSQYLSGPRSLSPVPTVEFADGN